MRAVVLGLLAAGLAMVATTATAQDAVRTRGWGDAERGRIVFDWAGRVDFTVRVDGRELIVRFNRSFDTDFREAVRLLNGYVTAGRQSEDRRSAIFSLAGDFRVETSRSEESVVIDLLRRPGSPATAPPATAPAAATPPAAAPPAAAPTGSAVAVRLGEHAGYVRLVFDWARNVDYTVARNGARLDVRFAAPARLDLTGLGANLPQGLSAPDSRISGGTTTFGVTLPDGARFRHFRTGTRVVVDVLTQAGASPDQIAAAPPPATQAPAPAPTPAPAPAPVPQPRPEAAPAAPPAASPATPARPSVILPQVPVTDHAPAPKAAPVKPVETVGVGTPAADGEVIGTEGDPDGAAYRPVGPAPASVDLVFEWPEPVGAAVFRRGRHLWIVFDRRTPLDLSPMRANARDLVDRMEQLPVGTGTVLRLATKPGINPLVRREGTAWVVSLARQELRPSVQIGMEVKGQGAEGGRLVLPISEAGGMLKVPDPEVGDMMDVATLRAPGHGIRGRRIYPQFELLASAQGIAIVPYDDELQIAPEDLVGLVLKVPGGLHITPVERAVGPEQGDALLGARLFDVERWQRRDRGPVPEVADSLLREVSEVPTDKRNEKRLALVEFYVANGLGHEALGVMRVMAFADPAVEQSLEYKALRGAAMVLAERYEEALKDLQDPRLDKFREGALWRASALAGLERYRDASRLYQFADPILRAYPHPLRGRLGVLRAVAAMEAFDMGAATVWFNLLMGQEAQLEDRVRSQVQFHQARLARAARNLDRAVELWTEVKRGGHAQSAAEAEYNLIDLGLQQETVSREEAIERLERLRFAWRGDSLELRVLRRLGALYLERDDFRNALSILRIALTHYPGGEAAKEITQQLTDIFKRLYLDGEADKMPPLTALALYDEFRELTPAGPDGDLMIQKLADRLVAVELLPRAASLLDHQIRFRLQGEEKARVGMKLAVIRLLDRDPQGALDALRVSFVARIPEAMEHDIRRIRAKATFELGRTAEAVALLAGDVSREADLLRADMFWRERNWSEAGKVLQRLAGQPLADGKGYDQEQAQVVLNWAVALRLDNDESGLRLVHEIYGPAMGRSPLADAFAFIASPSAGVAGRSITQEIAEIDNFQAFLKNYRDRLLKPSGGQGSSPGAAPPAPANSGTPPTPQG